MNLTLDSELLAASFQEVTGAKPSSITPLSSHASERRIYRLIHRDTTLIGVAYGIRRENDAFVALAHHFARHNLPVPRIYSYKPELGIYLEQDLGDVTLLDFLLAERLKSGEVFPKSVEDQYRRALQLLPRFQIAAASDLDFSICLNSNGFFSTTLLNDMRSFSTELVSRLLPAFDINSLNDDFRSLIDYLAGAKSNYFMYRDFQSRNIMLVNGTPYFIDFQSGLKGPLQYDVISLLYQSSAKIPDTYRESLVEDYLDAVGGYTQCDRETFFKYYPAFIISRMVQVLGVYGRQGLGANKEYFTKSIPAAVATLAKHLDSLQATLKLTSLLRCTDELLKVI